MAEYHKGPPRKEIVWEEIDELLEAGYAGSSIALKLGIHPETLYNRCEEEKGCLFSIYSQQRRQKGLNELRLAQHKNALGGNASMQIWLGKQYLDQKEPEPTISEHNKSALAEFIAMQKKEAEKLIAKQEQSPQQEKKEGAQDYCEFT